MVILARLSSRVLAQQSRLVGGSAPRAVQVALRTIYGDQSNVTYSGGQATKGQGGYYGSGGARVLTKSEPHRPEMLALAGDVKQIVQIMEEVELLEDLLAKEPLEKSIEVRNKIKKLMTSPEVMDCLNRLECIKGEPVWGLSIDERELIAVARQKVNEC